MAGKLVGVLALQGNFSAHQDRLGSLGAETRLVRRAADLNGLDALVLPGGESTTLLRLADEELRTELKRYAESGGAVLATCAGLILLARDVRNPKQDSLAILDIVVSRNAYGRQANSFIERSLSWTAEGHRLLEKTLPDRTEDLDVEGVFIRAPKILQCAKEVDVLLTRENEAVMIRHGAVFAATFHPELSQKACIVHELFLAFIPS